MGSMSVRLCNVLGVGHIHIVTSALWDQLEDLAELERIRRVVDLLIQYPREIMPSKMREFRGRRRDDRGEMGMFESDGGGEWDVRRAGQSH